MNQRLRTIRGFGALVGLLGLLLSALSMGNAQPIFQPASGCKEAAIVTTEQALNPGTGAFTQDRTILPGEDTTVVLGAWLILDAFVADPTANPANPNCPSSPGDGNPLYVVRLALRPVSGDPQAVGVKTVTFWLDNDFDGQFTPGRDTQFGTPLPGSCLVSSEGCVLTFGNSPIFGGPAGLADPTFGGLCLPLTTAGGCAAIFAVADIENPQSGATLQVRLEGKAANLVNNPLPIGSDFSPQFAKTASSIRVRVEGVSSGPGPGRRGGDGRLSPGVNNGSGNPEGGFQGISARGIRTRDDVGGPFGSPERDARPGDREYFVGIVALCDGGDIVTEEVTLTPPVAGVLTIAGGLGAIPCIGPGDGDGNPLNVVRVRVGVSGSGAPWVQAVHVYADTGMGSGWGGPGTGGTLFEPGEQILSAIPVNGVAAVGSLEQTLMTSGGTPLVLGPGLPGGPPGLLYVTVDIDDRALASQVTVQVAVDVADIPGTTSSNLLRTRPQAFTFRIAGAEDGGRGPAPEPGGLQPFDTNGNCVIDDPEFFTAVDAWVNGQIDNSTFFDLIDAWIQQINVCTSGSSLSSPIALNVGRTGVAFEASGPQVQDRDVTLGVRIHDLAGRTIWAGQTVGPRLIWRYRAQTGLPVANGVYLYAVTIRGANGEILHREVRKLLVLR